MESTTGFSSAIDGLLLIIEVRVVNTGCACDEKIGVSGYSG
jgi:hypothetical protein